MKPETWIFLRNAGRRYHWPADGADNAGRVNLRTEIAAALSEGNSWEAIADAALLPVATVRRYGEAREIQPATYKPEQWP